MENINDFADFADRYLEYLIDNYPELDAGILSIVETVIEATNWLEPTNSTDWNNLAVIDLINADQAEDITVKNQFLQMAIQKLETGYGLDQNPFCAAHYVIAKSILGEQSQSNNLAFNTSIQISQNACISSDSISKALIFLPVVLRGGIEFEQVLSAENGFEQAFAILSSVLWRSLFIFYNSWGIRSLHLAYQLFADNVTINLMLGVAKLMSRQVEGLVHLHHAQRLIPDYAPTLQSLYLGYRGIDDLSAAEYWLDRARNIALSNAEQLNNQFDNRPEWQWTKLAVDSEFTYSLFDQDIVLTVEPSFSSIVTAVVLAQGDWFEYEIDFWRDQIEEGMTIIDVGANAGVYTFSAAKRVGKSGLVIAIEPFSKCVSYLHETCRVNQMDWVKVCAGAASDRTGKAKLSINSASELNELISEDSDPNSSLNTSRFEEVDCFTLDSLIDEHHIERVDFLKIDAEGHELQVLKGSDRLLKEFKPIILYENIAGSHGCNLPVASFLRDIGYRLFCYQPYLKNLMPIDVNADSHDKLNIIAFPPLNS